MSPAETDPALNDQILQAMAARGGVKTFPAQSVLVNEEDESDSIFILLKGKVKIYGAGPNGREVVYTTLGPGEYFGEMTLDGGPRPASVVAEETTVCAVVTRQVVWDQVARDPALARLLIEGLIDRIRWTTQRARELALYDVYGRLRRLLDSLAEPPDENGLRPISERITHQAIASRVGSSREMVSRLMKDLERGGYVRNTRASVTLLKALPARW